MSEERNLYADIEMYKSKIPCPPLDIMLVGATTVGKSSTINAWAGYEVMKVGSGIDPETQGIWYTPPLFNGCFRFWDSQGLGDADAADDTTKTNILNYLTQTKDINGKIYKPYVDVVLVLLDGKDECRDLGENIQLLDLIFSCVDSRRVFFGINKADMVMKGKNGHWNDVTNLPDETLFKKLQETANIVYQRICERPAVKNGCLPINKTWFYSAKKGYDVMSLLGYILQEMPQQPIYQYRQQVENDGGYIHLSKSDWGKIAIGVLTGGLIAPKSSKNAYERWKEQQKANPNYAKKFC